MAVSQQNDTPAVPVARGRNFPREVLSELKKVTWPTLPEAWRLTVVVLSVIVAVAIYVGAIDVVLSKLTSQFKLIK